MSIETVEDCGWASATGQTSCDYTAPRVFDELAELKACRVLDLGSLNGAVCELIAARRFMVCGVDHGQSSLDLDRRQYPVVRFHRFGVQGDPDKLLALEAPFGVGRAPYLWKSMVVVATRQP